MTVSEEYATNALQYDNYYNIINGYKNPFLKNNNKMEEDVFIKGTDFIEVHLLYYLDSDLRTEFIRMTLTLENHIKSVIAYEFSKVYGHKDYLKKDNFDIFKNNGDVDPKKEESAESLIAQIQHDINYQYSKNNPMITHYMDEIGHIPMWVLVNILTFGTISKFFSAMKDKDKNAVAKKFGLYPHEMKQILSVLTLFRNHCAHNGIIYNYRCMDGKGNANKIPNLKIHNDLHIPKDKNNNYIYGKNDLFAIMIIFKIMDHSGRFEFFCGRIKSLLDIIPNVMKTIDKDKICKYMGLPENWLNIKSI